MKFLQRAMVVLLLAPHGFICAQTNPALKLYAACTFDDGLVVSSVVPVPTGVQGRTVATAAGQRPVALVRGEAVMFSYPDTDSFANAKVEQLPAVSFEQGKRDLVANFDYILAGSNDSERNYTLKPSLNGFEIYGMDRKKLEGKTMGIYLLIENRTHIVTTVYFLNQEAARRKFSSLEQYAGLRDHFLDAYTSCIHAPHEVKPAAKKAVPVKKKKRR